MKFNSNFFSFAKKPIAGEVIMFFAIFITLGAISGSLNHFGLEGDDKKLLFQSFLGVSFLYVVVSLSIRVKNYLSKNKP